MTTEKAIELLNRISDSQFDGIHGDERREALEMAVRALSGDGDLISRKMAIEAFEPTHYKDWYTPTIIETLETLPSVQLVKEPDGLVNDLVKDCISRQQAIDAVVSAMIDGADAELVEGVMELLPSAQPERPEQPESAKEYCAECNHIEMCRWYPYEGCEFRSLPSAQPERKKGKWITVPGRLGNEVECNKCHSVFWYWMGNYRFCPSCGADMRGESDEN